MSHNYVKSKKFCPQLNEITSPFDASNPLTYCLFPTLSSQFLHGSQSSNLLYGTYNPSCQNFMAEYCSQNWDKFCDTYEILNTDESKPNNAARDPENFVYAQAFLKNNQPTLGEMLVRNTVSLQFIDYPYITKRHEPFDPASTGSPMITIYQNQNIGPSFIKPIPNINNNHFIHKMLDNQKACLDVIARLYAGFVNNERNTTNFRKSILEEFFIKNQNMLNIFLKYPSNALQINEKLRKEPPFYLAIQITDKFNKLKNMKGSVGNLEIPDCQTAKLVNHTYKKLCRLSNVKYVTYMDEETAKTVLSRDIVFSSEIKTLKASMPKHLPKEPGTILEYDASQFS